MRLNIYTLFARIVACCSITLIAPSNAQDKPSSALEQVYSYCSVREASTEMMVRSRDSGVAQEKVFERLPPLTSNSNDAERATPARLKDVYAFRQLGGRTLFHYRVSSCLLGAMHKVEEPKFGMALNTELLRCQSTFTEDEALSVCIAEVANRLRRK
jgi:hypothetical protein